MDAGRTLGELARLVGGTLEGDPALAVHGIASLDQAEPGQLSFVAARRHAAAAERSRASAFLVPADVSVAGRPVIRVAQPYLALAALLRVFHPERAPAPGVERTAVVAASARIAPDATVLAFAVVGAASVVESRAVLHAHVVVGERCRVGEGSVLYPHVVLRDDVQVGRRVVIHPGAVLGADGFGYAFDGSRHQKIPQVGRVVIEDDVEIGANVTIDRATLGETVVRRGTKIDNLVQIGHNTVVGADTIIVAQTGVSGSCRIGDGVVLAGQVGIADHVVIGDGARVGAQSGVHQDVPAGGAVFGYPAMPATEARRVAGAMPRLPELLRAVRALKQRVAALEERLRGVR
ncbi:MAG: UDP-3-O-(3-hydroxymyristoyl)glucosamine N-acyltransferase [Candidatus Rokubacteria bacterium]|nr:UDP-3-O-(3-hydroxymyristoyl)glucosamine N-acyltransferase [Candidatus Rokubacteria bacterium]